MNVKIDFHETICSISGEQEEIKKAIDVFSANLKKELPENLRSIHYEIVENQDALSVDVKGGIAYVFGSSKHFIVHFMQLAHKLNFKEVKEQFKKSKKIFFDINTREKEKIYNPVVQKPLPKVIQVDNNPPPAQQPTKPVVIDRKNYEEAPIQQQDKNSFSLSRIIEKYKIQDLGTQGRRKGSYIVKIIMTLPDNFDIDGLFDNNGGKKSFLSSKTLKSMYFERKEARKILIKCDSCFDTNVLIFASLRELELI